MASEIRKAKGMGKIIVNYETDAALLTAADAYAEAADKHYKLLRSRTLPYTGWVDYASGAGERYIKEIRALAERIRADSDVFVVIGIGGSYLGARAACDFIGGGPMPVQGSSDSTAAGGGTEIRFAGFNLSGTYHQALLTELEQREFSIVQISKSGGTTEPGMAYRALRKLLIHKYGEKGADARTYAVTDPDSGALREEVRERGYGSLPIPGDIGGRYSVLTPVGLLPMAVSGIDIEQVIAGAADAASDTEAAKALRLACVRRAIQDTGKTVEVIGCFEPSMDALIQWILQLYGESEGKDGKGMLPVGVSLSRDLHSLGQFLQDGTQIFSETLINIAGPVADVIIGEDSAAGLFSGKGMNEVNRAVRTGMIRAHRSVGIPIVSIEAPDMSAHTFGQLVYFFELTCGATGLLMDVDPFDQPGVEAYKREMTAVLRASK